MATQKDLTREELQREVARLSAMLIDAGIDPARDDLPALHLDAAHAARSSTLAHAALGGPSASNRTALAKSAGRQMAVFESAIEVAIILTDPAGIITDWNSGAAYVTGWTAEEVRGQGVERFFTPADRASGRIAEEMQCALRNGRVADERWHLRKDGRQFWASGEMMPLYGDDNGHLGFMKILRDRTSEHLAGQALEEAKERYRLAAKATSDAVWDLHTNQVLWNEALEDAYGRQMADAGRQIRPELKTLFITGYAENAAIGDGQLGPGMLVLTKPFAVDDLKARGQELMLD